MPHAVLGAEDSAVSKTCPLFSHVRQGVRQGYFIVLGLAWWQLWEHVSRRPQKTLLAHSRSSAHAWRVLLTSEAEFFLGMKPSAVLSSSASLFQSAQQTILPNLPRHWSHPFSHSPDFYRSLNIYAMTCWDVSDTVLVQIPYSIFSLPVMCPVVSNPFMPGAYCEQKEKSTEGTDT